MPQRAGAVDAKNGDAPRILVGGKKERAGWIDAEVARGLAAGALVTHERELAVGSKRVDGDAVVPPVRGVEKLAGGRDVDVRTRVARAVGAVGERGDRIDGRQRALGGIECERIDLRAGLFDDVD